MSVDFADTGMTIDVLAVVLCHVVLHCGFAMTDFNTCMVFCHAPDPFFRVKL